VVDTLLGHDVETGAAVRLTASARARGLYLIGTSGMGKTTLIKNLVVEDITQGRGVCLLDPHGDLTTEILSVFPADRKDDLILLDVLDVAHPFGLNLFACSDPDDPIALTRTVNRAVRAFKKIWGPGTRESSWGPQMEDLLSNGAQTLAESRDDAGEPYTLAELPRLLTDAAFRTGLVAQLRSAEVRAFWREEYDPLRPQDQRDFRRSTMNKLRPFVRNPIVRAIVGQRRSSVEMRRAMDAGKVMLVRLAAEYEDLTGLLGTTLVGEVLTGALSRADMPEQARRPFHLYADEYERFATPDFQLLLAEARKYGVATTLAHQFREQLDEENRAATLAVRNLVVFAVSSADAHELARQFDTTPGQGRPRGMEPVLSISQDPVGHLMRGGAHPSEDVQNFVRQELAPMHDWLARLGPEEHIEEPIARSGYQTYGYRVQRYLTHRSSLQEGLQRINRYFADVMAERLTLDNAAEISARVAVAEPLRAYLAVAEECVWREVRPRSWEEPTFEHEVLPLTDAVRAALRAFLVAEAAERRLSRAFYRTLAPDAMIPLFHKTPEGRPAHAVTEQAFDALVQARLLMLEELLIPGLYQLYVGERQLRRGAEATYKHRAELRHGMVLRAEAECFRLRRFLGDLRDCAEDLQRDPIRQPSGQYQPVYEQLSHQDRANEIANELVRLPRYRARCRIEVDSQTGRFAEHTLQPLYAPVDVEAPAVRAWREVLIANSRARSTRPRAVVEAELTARQGRPAEDGARSGAEDGPAPPASGSGLRRREPLD
jgi:hypothetical protein